MLYLLGMVVGVRVACYVATGSLMVSPNPDPNAWVSRRLGRDTGNYDSFAGVRCGVIPCVRWWCVIFCTVWDIFKTRPLLLHSNLPAFPGLPKPDGDGRGQWTRKQEHTTRKQVST
jgi:hypothetical protein